MKTRIFLMASLLLAGTLLLSACGTPAPALSKLDVLVTLGGGGKLTPEFASPTTEYTLQINSDISGVGVVPTLPDKSTDKITIDGTDAKSGETAMVMPPVGESKVKIVVSDSNGKSTTYTITVTRENIQPVVDKFLKLSYADPDTGVTMAYRLFVPENYDANKTYPLVLFLHGAGETGSDNEIQLTANQGATVWAKPEEQAKHPIFVLAPQSTVIPQPT